MKQCCFGGGPVQLIPGTSSFEFRFLHRRWALRGDQGIDLLQTRFREDLSKQLICGAGAILRQPEQKKKSRGWGKNSWRSCPDSNEQPGVRADIAAHGCTFQQTSNMKAAGRQVPATADKLNGDMKRRPSYPGELRAKHANMSTKIWVKVAMAIVYFLCVSVAAFILVIYYVFFWTPDPHNNITITSTEVPNRTECATRIG